MRYRSKTVLLAWLVVSGAACACASSDRPRPRAVPDEGEERIVTPMIGGGPTAVDVGVDLRYYEAEKERLAVLLEDASEPNEEADLLLRLADLARDTAAAVVDQLTELESRCGEVGCGVGERDRKERLEHLEQRLEDEEVKALDRIVRDHPEFALVDEALYRLGYSLLDKERPDVALRHMRALMAKYPRSRYVPHAFLAFGDHYFTEEDIDKAIQLYQKVLTFGATDAAPHAHFKLGWCWLNRSDHKKALDAFVKAVEAVERIDLENGYELRRAALKDLVRAYAQVGQPAKAPEFFERIGGGHVNEMLELLAANLFDSGQYKESIVVNRQLLARVECSTIQARSQLGVYEAHLLMGDREQMLAEAKRMAEVFIMLGDCLEPEDLVQFVELGNVARENLKSQAAKFRAEFDETLEPAAAVMAEELEQAASAF
jgi:tetratricopeptide (TPR) repeat protein